MSRKYKSYVHIFGTIQVCTFRHLLYVWYTKKIIKKSEFLEAGNILLIPPTDPHLVTLVEQSYSTNIHCQTKFLRWRLSSSLQNFHCFIFWKLLIFLIKYMCIFKLYIEIYQYFKFILSLKVKARSITYTNIKGKSIIQSSDALLHR